METPVTVISNNLRSVMTFTDCDTVNGNSFTNDGVTWAYFTGSTTTVTVTINTNKTIDGIALPSRIETVNPGDLLIAGNFTTDTYNDVDGNVTFSVSDAVKVCLVEL